MGSFLECFEPDQLAVLSAVLAIALADGLDTAEINVLGNVLISVGSIMVTIAAQQDLLSPSGGNVTQ